MERSDRVESRVWRCEFEGGSGGVGGDVGGEDVGGDDVGREDVGGTGGRSEDMAGRGCVRG